MSNFKIGEIVIGQNFVVNTVRNGMECTVTSELILNANFPNDGFGYNIDWADGSETWQKPFQLRRKQPPAGEQSILNMFKLPAPKRVKETA